MISHASLGTKPEHSIEGWRDDPDAVRFVIAQAPIQSRIYQELSYGMLGWNQARKIADIPFPFPYAQLLTLMLVGFLCFTPFYVALFTTNVVVGPIVAYMLAVGYWGLNETAKELENPLGSDANDLDLLDFHNEFVNTCMEVYNFHLASPGCGLLPPRVYD